MESQLGPDLISRLRDALPKTRDWIVAYTQATAGRAISVDSLSIPNLTKVLIVDRVSYPPLTQFGLVEFKPLQETDWSGITYDQVYYLKSDVVSSALHFHELVHVVQCRRLGLERFLWAYSVGLATHRYEDSPLEKMAYDLQLEFEHGIYRRSLVTDIELRTDVIWQEAYRQGGCHSQQTDVS